MFIENNALFNICIPKDKLFEENSEGYKFVIEYASKSTGNKVPEDEDFHYWGVYMSNNTITTWDDIEKMMSGLQSAAREEETAGQVDQEKLAHFKQMILTHLDSIPIDRGTITDYTKWADIINEKVCDFHDERGIYPNYYSQTGGLLIR